MKKLFVLAFLLLPLFLASCSKESPNSPVTETQNSEGRLLLKIDKANTPTGVASVWATLSRAGYDSLSKSMNLKTDSTADISFSSITIGQWHLRIDARSSLGTILYTGETDVQINEAVTTQVNLTLSPTGLGVGNVVINVTWGGSASKWCDYLENPIFTSQMSPTYPMGGVSTAKVIYDNGQYKMWYLNTYNSGIGDVGYAVSNDGIHWSSPLTKAVLTPSSPELWDGHTVGPGAVLKENGTYKMYYIGWQSQYGSWNIGLATSSDGISWQKWQNPVLQGNIDEPQIGISDVIKSGSVYYMFYSSRNADLTNNRINVATSTDGINFIRYSGNPILVQSQAWEGPAITFSSVLCENGVFKLLYQSLDGKGFGYATSTDAFHWTKDASNPVFKASDVTNKWCQKVAYPFWKKFGNEYRLYYTGQIDGVNYIALATK